ncbi:MAG: type I-E CRISPR-associated protein Cas7/Cse4/CasC [Terriglobia bacterium]
MKHIALHILQPFPPSCLNRDDTGAPKTAIFGGVTRARISSQCLKREIRRLARESEKDRDGKLFAGSRTRKAAENLNAELVKLGLPDKEATETAQEVCDAFLSKLKKEQSNEEPRTGGRKGKTDQSTEPDEEGGAETSTLLYFSPGEIRAMANAIVDARKAGKKVQQAASQAAKKFSHNDAADIAIFGRMVANDATLNIEAAGLFSHAISTHGCDNDLDFWTAVDDERPEEEPGAANMGHAEFNAACYYRYAALDLDMLRDKDHLKSLSKEQRQEVVRAFLCAIILAVPPAKHTGMNANLPPEYVLGVVTTGQPMQLVNAFEAPVRANGEGWLKPSIEALEKHYSRMKKVFDLAPLICKDGEVRLSEETPLNQFIEGLVTHVE